MNVALLLANLVAAAYILWRAIEALNRMAFATHHGVRLAYLAAAVGGMAVLIGPLYGYVKPEWSEVLTNLAFGMYLHYCRGYCERLNGMAPWETVNSVHISRLKS